jgi:hypothetical protein
VKAELRREWTGEDAFIIGGGSSLRTFNFNSLVGKNTIGANDAFRLGPSVCRRVLFADHKFWKVNKWELEKYAVAGGIIYTICPDNERLRLPWLHQLYRDPSPGLSKTGPILSWNHNSGATAVNVALLLGAKRVFLLGFDMKGNSSGQTHWHNHRVAPAHPNTYQRFRKTFGTVKQQLSVKFPGAEIFNVTDGTSKLEWFPMVGFKDLPL